MISHPNPPLSASPEATLFSTEREDLVLGALAGLPIEHIAADPLLLDDIFYGVYDAPHSGGPGGAPTPGPGEVA